jgi:hypothetical protein
MLSADAAPSFSRKMMHKFHRTKSWPPSTRPRHLRLGRSAWRARWAIAGWLSRLVSQRRTKRRYHEGVRCVCEVPHSSSMECAASGTTRSPYPRPNARDVPYRSLCDWRLLGRPPAAPGRRERNRRGVSAVGQAMAIFAPRSSRASLLSGTGTQDRLRFFSATAPVVGKSY